MALTVYLISGANRGIGFGLANALAHREDALVFAGARNPEAAYQLLELQKTRKNLHIVKLTSGDEVDNAAAAAEIKNKAGSLHVVIANAAIMGEVNWPLETAASSMRETFDVNTVGPFVLFQATYPLLQASTPTPKFIGISASTGSLGMAAPWRAQFLPSGTSKAALNYVLRALRAHYDGLICFPINPNLVATDLLDCLIQSDKTGRVGNLQDQFQSIEDSAAALLKIIDSATRDTDAFMDADGSELPW